jgi:hypothetical protein|tara:strand:- start:410 stop:676 length:267 start_codon:yes stop_codon:yes gene_type:complete
MPKKKDSKLARAGVSAYNKPKRTPKHPTKKFVVVAKQGDKTKLIRFGDQKMTIKKNQPARRKSFRARHKCDTSPPDKLTARYWSCKKW